MEGRSWPRAIATLAVAASFACGGAGTAPNPPAEEVLDTRPPEVTVAEDKVDFGFVDCGGAVSAERSVKITNSGGGTVSWTAELEAPGFSIVGATSGTFTGGGAVNVRVRANAFAPNVEAGTVNRATLVVNIDNTRIYRTPLQVTSQGGTLSVLPGQAVFGEVSMNTQAPDLPLDIKNTGNKEVSISFEQPSAADFGIEYKDGPAEIRLAPGASVPGAVGRFRPTRLVQQSTEAPIRVKGAVCGASAKSVIMTGKGTGGVVGVSPGELDYGKVNCGTATNFQVLTLLNSGTAAFTFSLSLGQGAGSYFTVSPSSGTVLAGSQQGIFITPKAIPSTSAITDNLYGDVLTVTTNAANDTPHDVKLLMGARGAILAFTATPSDYGTSAMFGAPIGKTATVTNTGNASANVTFTRASTAYTFSVGGGTLNGPGALSTTVNFAPTAFGDNDDTLGVSTASTLCAALPAGSPLTGKGKGVASQVAVGSLRSYQITGNHADSTCALITGGHVACWGDNRFGQMGNGTFGTTPAETPVVVSNLANAVAITGGGDFNCARTTANTAVCWGNNAKGQLGVTGGGIKTSPVQVSNLTNVISLSASYRHACAVNPAAGGTSGKVYCWGKNARGQLGNNTATGQNAVSATPVEVPGIADAVTVSASPFGGCARRANNTVSCWGQTNYRGQLGSGNTSFNTGAGPLAVVNLTNAASVVASGGRASGSGGCALQSTGGVACWGQNRRSQAAPGSGSTLTSATVVPGIAGATAVARGGHHSCAIIGGANTVTCWGGGDSGQLGNGTAYSSGLVSVTGVSNVVSLSAAGNATCAVITGGSVKCWGQNDMGQLGNPAAGGETATTVFGF